MDVTVDLERCKLGGVLVYCKTCAMSLSAKRLASVSRSRKRMTITVMVPPDPRGGARGRAMRVMLLLLLLLLPSDGMKIIMAVPVVNGERIYMYAYKEATKYYVFIDFVSFEL